jgi:nucleoid-associated protein YgaU
MKLFRLATFLCGAAMLGPLPDAKGSDLEQEYQQVKRIAMKDLKVRAAFDRAYDKLNKRIVEIDPALKPFIEAQNAKQKPKQPNKISPRGRSGSSVGVTHIVTQGETLTSIAKRYKVSVNSLVKTNNIAKEGTLQIGQKLTIPSPARR